MIETVLTPPSGHAVPIAAPAESGPISGRRALGSIRTNEPQPAPTESICTSGMFSMNFATSGVVVTS